jgi:hypothetical protein
MSSPKGCECDSCLQSPHNKTADVAMFDLLNGSMTTTDGDPQMHFLSDYILRGYALKEQLWCECTLLNHVLNLIAYEILFSVLPY